MTPFYKSYTRPDEGLEIELAELQADVQIYLTACFGVIALVFALIIGFEQMIFNPSTSSIVRDTMVISILAIAPLGFIFFLLYGMKSERLEEK